MNQYEENHIKRLRPYLAECCVLLKNKGDFPITDLKEIALYGDGVRHTYKGGTGSGEVNSRFYDTIEKGFENAEIAITTKEWLDSYDKILEQKTLEFVESVKAEAKAMHKNVMMICMGKSMPAPEYEIPLEGAGNTALYVVSRESGEGADRAPVKGDIMLSDSEVRDIKALNSKYEHFMLVLNVGGPVDLSEVSDVENVLVLSQLGIETGDALADIVTGKANPSGKLTTTWTSWEDYPDFAEFGGYDETRYKEGIYVGYKYFDSVDKTPLFPFGHGLSYTSFSIDTASISNSRDKITISVQVKNTGAYAGKEVVQAYVSAPSVTLDKPYQTLAGFTKTKELGPNEVETVEVTFSMSDLASYDEASAAYVLEPGDYIVRVGNSSRNTTIAGVISLSENVKVKQVKNLLGKADFKDFVPEILQGESEYETANIISLSSDDFTPATVDYTENNTIDPRIKALSDGDLLKLAMGYFDPKNGLPYMIGNAGTTVAGTAGESAHVDGLPYFTMADGPAGLRLAKNYFINKKTGKPVGMASAIPDSMMLFATGITKWVLNRLIKKPKHGEEILHQYCTAIPIGTAIAESWNEEFAEICGDIVGTEMDITGVDMWLAPALNIHRNIRCGRNFEYFSEDPLISGKFAAAITRGVQKHNKKAVTIKHFAANNQELNRTSSNSIISERALREIYLKGFEICIKESAPLSVMSSYNLINGVHTSESYELITDILRHEFGFDGFVMTDWVIDGGMIPKDAKYGSPNPALVAAAGNDVFMPGSKKDFKDLCKGYESGLVSRKQLEINASRLVCMYTKNRKQ